MEYKLVSIQFNIDTLFYKYNLSIVNPDWIWNVLVFYEDIYCDIIY